MDGNLTINKTQTNLTNLNNSDAIINITGFDNTTNANITALNKDLK
jgi:lysine/ornithine N-monooxygenase